MKRGLLAAALWLPLSVLAPPASAQHGEVQLGGVVSYGAPDSFREGAGLVAGVAVARLLYVGVRYVYQAGTSQILADAASSEVRSSSQLLMADVGLTFPVGAFELVPGFSLGAARFTQRGPGTVHRTKFVTAPGASVHARLLGLIVIPEVQYYIASEPALALPVAHRGAVAALRVVFPFEVRRIRY